VNATAVLEDAWGLYSRHWKHFITLAAIVFVGVAIISALLSTLGAFGGFLSAIVTFAGLFLVWGALVTAVDDVRDGKVDLSVQDTFRASSDRLGHVALAGFILAIIVVIGLILLIVPGLIAMTWLFAVVPVVVLEKKDFATAFSRSIELVKGHAWQVFVLILLVVLIVLIVNLIVGLILGAAGPPFWLNTLIRSIVANVLVAPFLACALTLGYFVLRDLEADGGSGTLPPAA
jgi:hypothetical protein